MSTPRPSIARTVTLCAAAVFVAASPLRAQRTTDAPPPHALPLPGSEAEATVRLQQLVGAARDDGMLLRSVGSRIGAVAAGRDTMFLFAPELFSSYNSAHPWGFNDGPLRAGRGANLLLTAGFAAHYRKLSIVVVPQFVHEANLDFQTLPFPQTNPPGRNVWANPFYPLPMSLDYPQRFGDVARTELTMQGRVAFEVTPSARVGVSTENRWWGPGVRNGLVLSAHAPGFAHLFVESPRPIETRLGRFDYNLLLGKLEESPYFDFDPANDVRSLSAAAVTWQAPASTGNWPAIGVSRAVIAQQAPGLATALDFARNTGRPWSRPADAEGGRDQIFALFSRWLFPEYGAEAYVEWARFEQVANVRELLEQPGHMQGYTLGAQWARPWRTGILHFHTEFNYLEPSASVRTRPIGTTYTSRAVPQGWTHRGEMLGPSIGPGASSQFVAGDLRMPRWRTGLSLGRWRRDANFRFENYFGNPFMKEDLQLWASFRAGVSLGPFDALAEYTNGVRLNHLYQAYDLQTPGGETEGIDLHNRTLTVTLTPRRSLRGP